MFFLWLRQLSQCADRTPASVPQPAEGRPSPTNTPVSPLVPSSYWVLRGSIYSFPLVSYFCPISAGVLHALLCLKVYSWYIRGERCTPCPPTPLPSKKFLKYKIPSAHLSHYPLPSSGNYASVLCIMQIPMDTQECLLKEKSQKKERENGTAISSWHQQGNSLVDSIHFFIL